MTASAQDGFARWATRRVRSAARVLVHGVPSPEGTNPRPRAAPPTATAKRPTTNIPGRWIREVSPANHVYAVLDRRVDDPTEAAALDAGWLLIDAHERLSLRAAARVFGHELAAWNRYTDETIAPLAHPSWSDDATIADQIKHEELPTNRLRYRRTMDFVRAGDRLFDVGYGRGYLASLLIRDAGVESYHGIDILDDWRAMSLATLAANDLADAPVQLETGDLYDLTREKLDAVGATFVICCEVLEHVPDAEKALRVLADALPAGADLLFSVPLHGRLESVFGHVSVFDVARLKQMLDGAGLYAHHVEPLANTWSLVLASRDPAPSVRVREATRRPPVRTSVPLVAQRDFVDVVSSDMATTGGATMVVGDNGYTTAVRLEGDGGITFPVSGLEALRLLMVVTDGDHVSRFTVTARDGGRKLAIWTWYLEDFPPAQGARRYSLRPGETIRPFQGEMSRDTIDATHVEVRATVSAGHSAQFDLRAAYLP